MDFGQFVNRGFLSNHVIGRRVLPTTSSLAILISLILVFLWVPNERDMGAVQRIFYFHVGSAFATYLMILFMLIAALFYFATRDRAWDLLGAASGRVGFLFCSIVLSSGMIWGRSAWNAWWNWEPRLVSFLVLWLTMLAYQLLRASTDAGDRQASVAGVLAIFAAVNVPIVIFSVRLLSHVQQIHPQVIAEQGLRDPRFGIGLAIVSVALLLFSIWLVWIELLRQVLARDLARMEQL